MAKDVQRFKALNGKGFEYQLGQIFLYFFSSFDPSILLTTDRKQLLSTSWE
jgi:hypothetical protein